MIFQVIVELVGLLKFNVLNFAFGVVLVVGGIKINMFAGVWKGFGAALLYSNPTCIVIDR